ncbi:MAG TPA: nitrous oxide reductase family maturation protein NosD [Burkholderiaceae bacterium]|nr:nitrous oxide reductase family maturation protein NosD [Burkholderiaceae bacterium]
MRLSPALLAAALLAAAAGAACAAERRVAPGEALQPLVDAAAAGDVLRLEAGRHAGPVRISRSLSLVGEPGAVLAGPGRGTVVEVDAPDVRIEGLEITGSGRDLPAMDSAVLLQQSAVRAEVKGNRLRDNLFGVYVHGARDSNVQDNLIEGRNEVRTSEAGDGISVWNAPGARIVGNTVRGGRDGVLSRISRDNVFERNSFSNLRFAIHYMHTQDSRVVGNRSRGNHVGWAMMYSDRVEIRDNVSDDDRDHGLLLNTTNDSTIVGNVVRRSRDKCVFVYNASHNVLRDNWFEGCPIGIHFTAGSERNALSGNAFVANRLQVKYVGTRFVDWAHDGRGNYWSDNPAYDLNGDGIADRPYRPNDVMDQLLWTLPGAKALVNSPAVQMVRWAQARFPALYPGGVIDSAPLMRPERVPPGRGPS